jgi:hypothetical protein
LSLGLILIESITLFNKFDRSLAEQQPANLDIVFETAIGID